MALFMVSRLVFDVVKVNCAPTPLKITVSCWRADINIIESVHLPKLHISMRMDPRDELSESKKFSSVLVVCSEWGGKEILSFFVAPLRRSSHFILAHLHLSCYLKMNTFKLSAKSGT